MNVIGVNKDYDKPYGLCSISFFIVVLFSVSPQFFWVTHPGRLFGLGLVLIFTLVGVLCLFKRKCSNFKIESLMVFFFFSFTCLYFYGIRGGGVDNLFTFFRVLIPLYLLIFIRQNTLIKSHEYFFNVLFFVSLFSLITWLLVLFGGPGYLNFGTISPASELKSEAGLFYYDYIIANILSNQYEYYNKFCFSRISGFLDEPGYWGTIVALIIISTGTRYGKIKYFTIMSAGFLTFSLAYYVLIITFFILAQTKKFVYFSVILVPVLFFVFFFFPSFGNYFEDKIISRAVVSNGNIQGNNRSSLSFDKEFENYIFSTDVFLGRGHRSHSSVDPSISTWKTLLYNYGYFGLFTLFLSFLGLFFIAIKGRNINKNMLIYVFVFFLALLQRPQWHVIVYPFIFYIGIILLSISNDTSFYATIKKNIASVYD